MHLQALQQSLLGARFQLQSLLPLIPRLLPHKLAFPKVGLELHLAEARDDGEECLLLADDQTSQRLAILGPEHCPAHRIQLVEKWVDAAADDIPLSELGSVFEAVGGGFVAKPVVAVVAPGVRPPADHALRGSGDRCKADAYRTVFTMSADLYHTRIRG